MVESFTIIVSHFSFVIEEWEQATLPNPETFDLELSI